MITLFKNPKFKFWAWSLFDAGNSAHALLVSTVGYALYFKQVLFANDPKADSLWALITVIILSFSALISPFLTSWLSYRHIRWLGLSLTTFACVISTMALSMPISVWPSVVLYFLSAVGYYVALPIYNTYLEEVSNGEPAKASARGWAVGYIGGIVVAVLAFAFGLLSSPVTERPDLYRLLFVLAGIFNLVFSLPIMLWAWANERISSYDVTNQSSWNPTAVMAILWEKPALTRVLSSYWMVGECATITVYFTAIFLAQYVNMPTATIFALTLALQGIGAVSTWIIGGLTTRLGSGMLYKAVCLMWAAIPTLLWLISKGLSYWYALVAVGLVIGAHHTLVRAEIAATVLSSNYTPATKGSIFGLLEVTGRITSVLGPLAIAILTMYIPLAESLLVATLFPIIALILINKYKWQTTQF